MGAWWPFLGLHPGPSSVLSSRSGDLPMSKISAGAYYCDFCDAVVIAHIVDPAPMWIGCILLLLGILPGLIFFVWLERSRELTHLRSRRLTHPRSSWC